MDELTHGMDIDAVEDLGRALQRHSGSLEGLVAEVDLLLRRAPWTGYDADLFSDRWWPQHRSVLQGTAEGLYDLGRTAMTQAGEQARASGVDVGGHGAAAWALGGLGVSLDDVFDALDTYGSLDDLLTVMPQLAMGLAGGAAMLGGRLLGDGALWRSGLGRYAAANRWLGSQVAGRFWWTGVVLDLGEAAYAYQRYGAEDSRFIIPVATAGGTLAAAGGTAALVAAGVVSTPVAAPAAVGAAAFGAGIAIGEGVNWASEQLTGASVSDHWAQAAVGNELDAMNAKLERGELLSDEENARLEHLSTPWGTFTSLFGF